MKRRGERSKDAAEGTPVRGEVEEENESTVAMKEKSELNDMRNVAGMYTHRTDSEHAWQLYIV